MEKLRFKDDNGNNYPEWGVCKLSSIAKTYDGTHQTPKYTEFGIPFLSVTNLTQNNFKNTKFISEEVYNKEKTKIEVGNILMTKIGDIGTTKHIDEEIKASYYVSLALIKVNDNINSKYLNYALNSPTFQVNLKNRSLLNAFPQKINLGEIGKCNIPLSNNIQEQDKIGSYFSNLEKLIHNTQRELELVESYKKDMLHKIFNQKIRFKDENGNDYPEWKIIKISEISDVVCGKSPKNLSSPKWYSEKGIGFMSISDINDAGKVIKTEKIFTNEAVKNSCLVPKNSLILSIYASIGKLVINENDICIHQGFVYFKDNQLNNIYMKSYLEFFNNNKGWNKISQGTTQLNLNKNQIKNLKIIVPKIEEQNKISELFSGIDSEILNLKNSLKSLNDLKKDMLEKMF